MLRWLILCLLLPVSAHAASPEELDRLRAAFGAEDLIAILSEEGIAQSEDLRESMFPGRGGTGWTRVVQSIYDPTRLGILFDEAFDAVLTDVEVTRLLDFYASETGTQVANLEVTARRAIMDEDVEDAARTAWADIAAEGTFRSEQLREFAEVNDLVDQNVAGALNASLLYYKGLTDDGTFEMSEDEILDEVWASEAETRADTEGWVFGYMAMAYEPMSDAAFQEYVDLAATEGGQALNRAMFAGFEAIFQDVSFALGRATARFTLGDEL